MPPWGPQSTSVAGKTTKAKKQEKTIFTSMKRPSRRKGVIFACDMKAVAMIVLMAPAHTDTPSSPMAC